MTRLSTAVILHIGISLTTHCAGQGFKPSESSTVGAATSYNELAQLYSKSRSWRNSYKLNPASACSKIVSGSLCAAAASDGAARAQLMLAASPQSYSALDAKYTGGLRLVAAPIDQQSCDTCSAVAVTSAAETAIASVSQVNVADCSISVQALHFCPPGDQPARQCKGGWSIPSTLSILQYSQHLPTEDCLPYKPDVWDDTSHSELCSSSCATPNQFASQGGFSSIAITSIWEAQKHIRQYGGVVTRFDIMDDFTTFFSIQANAQEDYTPQPGAKLAQGHAVVLVGYNNDQQYWIVKNSWGPHWADNGFFRVAYNVCSVLTPDRGEAYGIIWEPKVTASTVKLGLSPGPRAGCYWYKAHAGDYLSRVAWLADIPLDKFMLDNAVYVKDLDAPLDGTNLLVCNPDLGGAAMCSSRAGSLYASWTAKHSTMPSFYNHSYVADGLCWVLFYNPSAVDLETQSSAEKTCKEFGGHLATVNSAPAAQLMQSMVSTIKQTYIWIGLWSGGMPTTERSKYR